LIHFVGSPLESSLLERGKKKKKKKKGGGPVNILSVMTAKGQIHLPPGKGKEKKKKIPFSNLYQKTALEVREHG